MYSYKDEQRTIPKRVILLENCVTSCADQHTMKCNSFAIYHKNRKARFLQPDDGSSQEDWCAALLQVMDGMAKDKENRGLV